MDTDAVETGKREANVRELYEEFPFPYRGNHADLMQRYVFPHIPFTPARILDAGCGTGNLTLDTARRFPNARITGVDFSEASLDRARTLASEAGITNLQFRWHDLMQPFSAEDTATRYDLVTSIGCIHHTPDPHRCLRNLRGVLADNGIFIICIYGKHGRIETELRRELVDHIRKAAGKSNRELLELQYKFYGEPVLATNRLRKLPELTPRFLFSTALNKLRAKLPLKAAKPADESDHVGEADQFLHPLVHSWSAREWITALETTGFRIRGFGYDPSPRSWCIPRDPLEQIQSPELRAVLQAMTPNQQYEAFDLMFRPLLHFIVCGPG